MPTNLTGTAALVVPLVAALFVGLSKLLSMWIAGRKERAQIVANEDARTLQLKLAQAEMRYETLVQMSETKYNALLERYNDLKEAFNELKSAQNK